MRFKISDIKIDKRIRHDMGDLSQLKDSIRKVGLLQPIIVNFEKELVAGFRRLEVCKQLGWSEIEVTIVDTNKNKIKKLDLEFHENIGRVEFNHNDQQNYDIKREELLNPPEPPKGFWIWLKSIIEKIKKFFQR